MSELRIEEGKDESFSAHITAIFIHHGGKFYNWMCVSNSRENLRPKHWSLAASERKALSKRHVSDQKAQEVGLHSHAYIFCNGNACAHGRISGFEESVMGLLVGWFGYVLVRTSCTTSRDQGESRHVFLRRCVVHEFFISNTLFFKVCQQANKCKYDSVGTKMFHGHLTNSRNVRWDRRKRDRKNVIHMVD